MKIKILSDVDGLIKAFVGGRTCYSVKGPLALYESYENNPNEFSEKAERFLEKIISSGHGSVLEHWNFTILIEGVSRSLTHQLVRHRLASYSQASQRYITVKNMFEFVTPPMIGSSETLAKTYQNAMEDAFNYYRELYEELYDDYIEQGISKHDADKKAAEDARYVLPNATCSNIVMTVNLRELQHIMSERLCLRAQWEIRDLFKEIRKELCKQYPFLGKHLGPKCMFGSCAEEDGCVMKGIFFEAKA